jgi:hypothetical protein
MSDFILRQAFIYFVSFLPGFLQTYRHPTMELVPATAVGTSDEVSTILAMSYAELRAIVVASIVRNTNDKTKMTSLSVEIPVGLLKGGEPNSGNSIQIRATSNTHKRNMRDKIAVGFHAHSAFLVRYPPSRLC